MVDWQPIETAPKDGTKIDIWAKCWRAEFDDFIELRFTDCYWAKGDSMTSRRSRWACVEDGWCPQFWMPLPDPPKR